MTVTRDDLSRLFPLGSLRPETLDQMAAETRVQEFRKGDVVFQAGSTDEHTVYLVEGELKCEYPDGRDVAHIAGTNHGRYALNDAVPRRFSAIVNSNKARIYKLDRRYTEKLITWDQISRDVGAKHFDASPGGNDWIYRLLQRPAFLKLPAGNLEKMFALFEEVRASKGETIIREGDPGDYFYVIREGRADVTKHLDGVPFVVASLEHGAAFGEDALLSNVPRNATVKMTESGRLMRLSKVDFESALKPPMVSWVLPAEAAKRVKDGAVVVDVRMAEEFAQRAIDGAVNVPLNCLREVLPSKVGKDKSVIVYCNTGERSAAAAFVLKSLDYDVSALHGGLGAMLRMVAAQQAQLEAFTKKFG
jgi:CRP-like cAMP-binding protein